MSPLTSRLLRASAASALLALIGAGSVAAAPGNVAIQAEAIEAHVAFLADDLLAGRAPGTDGYDIAARYVATQLAAAGLKPVAGGSWYQPVPMVEQVTRGARAGELRIDGQRVETGVRVELTDRGDTRVVGPAVFVGRGLKSAVNDIDEYAGLDVRGKVVVAFNGFPTGFKDDKGYSRVGAARKLGAIGFILLEPPAGTPKAAAAGPRSPEVTRLDVGGDEGPPNEEKFLAFAYGAAAAPLFAKAGESYAALEARAKSGAALKAMPLGVQVAVYGAVPERRFTSPNVLAVLPGSDPALARDYVLVMAHLDHVGHDDDVAGDDKIFNGALDNAAGIATMIESARALGAGKRSKRPILFAAVTGEERGLLGSKYLADHLPAGVRVSSVVNLDMPVLLYDFTDVTAFGAEHSTMGEVVRVASAREGVTLSPDPLPAEKLFTRSDHYNFVQKGVPSVFLMTGFANGGKAAFEGFLATHYHRPSDQLSLPINWAAGAKFARINTEIVRSLANATSDPRWYADSDVGQAFAPQQPKATRPKAK